VWCGWVAYEILVSVCHVVRVLQSQYVARETFYDRIESRIHSVLES
jgi:hypothetical protein